MKEDKMNLHEKIAGADGADCICHAHGECECACDADWTPAEVYRLQAQLTEKQHTIEVMQKREQELVDALEGLLESNFAWLTDKELIAGINFGNKNYEKTLNARDALANHKKKGN